jgi:hypothetical protein
MTCKCVKCPECRGAGSVWWSFAGEYLGRSRCDNLDEIESCDECDGTGITELCDECREAEEREQELLDLPLPARPVNEGEDENLPHYSCELRLLF